MKKTQLKPASKIGLALVGGFFMGMTTAPIEAWFLAWIALVPLWVLMVEAQPFKPSNGKNRRRLIENGSIALAWGIGYHGLALFWLTGVHPMTWMGVPWLTSLAIALFCWVLVTLWGASVAIAWSIGMTVLNQKIVRHYRASNSLLPLILLRVTLGFALWCVIEAIWSIGPLYWSSLSYTQSPNNLVILHLGQLSGPSTVTASIVLVNGLIAEAIIAVKQQAVNQRSFYFLFTLPISVFLVLHGVGWTLYSRPVVKSEAAAITVGIIQGNIPNEIKLYPEGWRRAIEGYTTGYKTLAQANVEVVLTPETALPVVWSEPVEVRSSLYQAILQQQVPVWIGAFGEKGTSLTNSLFTVAGTGKPISRYDKVELVPLGEYIPFEEALGRLINRLSPLDAHLAAGAPNQVFETPFGRAIVGICYESAFPQHFRRQAAWGGEFIITASNNAHYSNTMPAQHHAQDVMRAIETDRWAARATNTGYSAIVDPHGRTLWISEINDYEIHADTIYRRQTKTPYVKWGNWLTVLLLVVSGSGWFFLRQ